MENTEMRNKCPGDNEKNKISHNREHPAVFNNGLTSTMQGVLYMAPDQTKTNVRKSTPVCMN